jgi:hypothetical protein
MTSLRFVLVFGHDSLNFIDALLVDKQLSFYARDFNFRTNSVDPDFNFFVRLL